MKQLTSYNRVAGYLNKLFDLLNGHYFENALTRPTITIQSTPRAYGHFSTRDDTWVSVTGNSNEIKTAALLQEIKSQLEQECHFNINDILQTAYISTRAEMSDSEQRQFYNRYIKPMKLVIDDDGNASIKLG